MPLGEMCVPFISKASSQPLRTPGLLLALCNLRKYSGRSPEEDMPPSSPCLSPFTLHVWFPPRLPLLSLPLLPSLLPVTFYLSHLPAKHAVNRKSLTHLEFYVVEVREGALIKCIDPIYDARRRGGCCSFTGHSVRSHVKLGHGNEGF